MATTKTRKTAAAKAGTSRAKTTAKATGKGKTAAKSAEDTATKREMLAEQNAAHTERIVEMREAESSWAEIAEELSITPGKAQFLMMKHLVAEGEVPAITARNDADMLKKLVAARNKADGHSSWGWLSARSGLSEGVIKAMLAESGDYEPRAENIAAIRAEKNGGSKPAKKEKATPAAKTTATAKKATGGTAKTTAARKRAAARAGKGSES